MSTAPRLTVLETERLVLRRQTPDDAEAMRRLWAERDPRVPAHRRLTSDGHPTVDEIAERIREDDAGGAPGLLSILRRDRGEMIGYCGLVARGDRTADEPELAFELEQASHGCGYATEAARAVVEWADASGLVQLHAEVWDWNTASRRVLAKLGFREVGRTGRESVHGHSLLTTRTNATAGSTPETTARPGTR